MVVAVPAVVEACTLRRLAAVWRVLLVHVLMVGGLIGPGMAMAAVTTVIDTAHTTSTVEGLTTVDPQGRLPYHWDLRHGEVNGQVRFVAEVAPDTLTAPLTLYIPRIGNTFVIVVNGRELARFGTLPPNLVDDAATGPRKFVIPAEWLEPRTTIDITIGVRGGRMGGLSVLTLGPESAVRGAYALAYVQEVSGRLVLVVATALLGVLGLLLWLRLRDVGYLYYGLAELLWTVVTMRPLFEEAPLPWPVWGYVYKAAFVFAVPLQCKFALMVVNRTEQWPARLNHGLLLLSFPIVALGMALGGKWLIPLWQGVLVLDMCVVAWAIIDARNCGAEQERKVLAVASVVLVVAAARDLLALTFSPDLYPTLSWVRFAWTAFGMSFAWVFTERMRRTSAELADLNLALAEQLSTRNAELTDALARERTIAVAHGATQERQRLMRDLHDGLGGHLVGALRMAQQSATSKQDLAKQVRAALDQLKITVDAMQETDGDLASLLGAVRYRLNSRLEAAGIALQWRVDNLPAMAHWGVRQSYDLQMILFEIFTNMMVHAGASQASLVVQHVQEPGGPGRIEIEVSDNGKGFACANASDGADT